MAQALISQQVSFSTMTILQLVNLLYAYCSPFQLRMDYFASGISTAFLSENECTTRTNVLSCIRYFHCFSFQKMNLLQERMYYLASGIPTTFHLNNECTTRLHYLASGISTTFLSNNEFTAEVTSSLFCFDLWSGFECLKPKCLCELEFF